MLLAVDPCVMCVWCGSMCNVCVVWIHVWCCVSTGRGRSEQSPRRWRPGLHIGFPVFALKLIRPLSLSLPPPLRYHGNHLSLWKTQINAHCSSFVISSLKSLCFSICWISSSAELFSHALFTLSSFPPFLNFRSFSPFCSSLMFYFLQRLQKKLSSIHWNLCSQSASHSSRCTGEMRLFQSQSPFYPSPPLVSLCPRPCSLLSLLWHDSKTQWEAGIEGTELW